MASLTTCTLICYFRREYIMFEPKKYREVMCYNTEEWCKIWGMTDYINFELINCGEVMYHDTEGWCSI